MKDKAGASLIFTAPSLSTASSASPRNITLEYSDFRI